MTKLLLILISIVSINSFAEDSFILAPIKFQIATTHPLEKLEISLNYPEGLLNKFKPEGAKISKKQVSGNNVSFYATKTYMLVSQKVKINGVFDSSANANGCEKKELGYDINFSFEGSDSLVYDNFERIDVKLCVKIQSENLIILTLRSKLMKGNHFSNIVGSFVKDMLVAQINPIIRALSEDVLTQ